MSYMISHNMSNDDDDDDDTTPTTADKSISNQRRQLHDFVFGCDRWPLHYACRTGNVNMVHYMLETLCFTNHQINEMDDHNATPLYLAALTGQTTICQLLLQYGANCNDDDAARIFYVALTPSLRSMLREWSLSAASTDPYLQSLQQIFYSSNKSNNTVPQDNSMKLNVAGTTDGTIKIWLQNEGAMNCGINSTMTLFKSVAIHRVMIQYRCEYLFDLFDVDSSNDDDKNDYVSNIYGNDVFHCNMMYQLIEYLYTGKLEFILHDTPIDDIQSINHTFDIIKLWKLIDLFPKVESMIDQLHIKQQQHIENKSRKYEISLNNVLRNDMERLAHAVSMSHSDYLSYTELTELISSSDLTISCHNNSYSVHRFRFVTQSDYFNCALHSNFIEASTSNIDLSHMVGQDMVEIVPLFIQWMYTDTFLDLSNISIDMAIEVIQLGAALLCPSRLCSYVVNTIIVPNLHLQNVFDILEYARSNSMNFDQLEEKCCMVIALNLDEVIEQRNYNDELYKIILSEVSNVQQGGDVMKLDVPIIAEIRRAIHRLGHHNQNEKIRKRHLLQNFVDGIVQQLLENEQLEMHE